MEIHIKKRSVSQDAFSNWRFLFGLGLSSGGVALALLGLSVNSGSTAMAQGARQTSKVQVTYPYHQDVSPAMRDVNAWPMRVREEREGPENPRIRTNHTDQPDLVVQKGKLLRQLAPNIPQPILNFDGIPDVLACDCEPPDTNGEVGATQYVQTVNSSYQVYDKATGNSVLGPSDISSIWTGFGGACELHGFGDPVVLYDQMANRWMISQFASPTGNIPITDECIAVSTSSDATGTWNRYGYHLGSNFFDYPHLGVWPDAYYMSMNVFNSTGTAYLGVQPWAFDRAKMIAGQTATMVTTGIVTGGPTNAPMLPADLDGSTLPPSGAPNPFVMWPFNGKYNTYRFHVDFVNTSNSTFTLAASPSAAGFTEICPTTRACVPQKGTTAKLDAIGDRLMFRLAYRNFGDHESLVGNYTVNVSGIAGIRWFELRGVTTGTESVYQESTYSPDSTWRWMGSVAMDKQGNMALGFSASDSTISPQIRYTGRLVTDPINTMGQGEGHIFDGTGSQSDTTYSRWGDYSDITVDPVDDQTFWYTQEYYATTSSFNWRTRIASFSFGSSSTLNLLSASSRATHGRQGPMDISMPLTGNPGIECRATPIYRAVFTFDGPVTAGDVSVVGGSATVQSVEGSGNELVAQLTGLGEAQVVTLRVANVNGDGQQHGDVQFGILIGDVNGDGVVNLADGQAVKNAVGQKVTSSNFRDDVNTSGQISNQDVRAVRRYQGNSLQ